MKFNLTEWALNHRAIVLKDIEAKLPYGYHSDVATFLTIFFLPALYAAWFRVARQTNPDVDRASGDPAFAA